MKYLHKFTFYFTIILLSPFFLTSVTQIKPMSKIDRLICLQKRKLAENNPVFKTVGFRNTGPTKMNESVVNSKGNPYDPSAFYVAYFRWRLWYTINNGKNNLIKT